MRRLAPILLLIALPCTGYGADARHWVSGASAGPAGLELTGTPELRVVSWTLDGFGWEELWVAGTAVSRLDLPGQPMLRESGRPEVPVVPVALDLLPRGAVRLKILEHRERAVALPPVAVSLGHRPHVPGSDPEAVGSAASPATGLWPPEPAVLATPYLAAGRRGVSVRLQPLRWDADRNVLMVTEYIRLAVVTDDGPGMNEQPSFGTKSAAGLAPRMLLVAPPAWHNELAEFADWKTRRGMEVELVSPADLGGTAAGIAAGIGDRYYEAAGLQWVVLVGDRAQVPSLVGTHDGALSDQRYAMVAGDDLRPDLMVSRLPARNEAEVLTQVNRILAYERDAAPGSGQWDRAGGVASDEGSPADHERAEALRADLLAGGFSAVDQVYQADGAVTSDVAAAVEGGASLLNYMGHGSGTAWQSVPFDTDDVRALDNTDHWPWIVDASCLNGDFARDECLAEAWLRAGEPAAPAGAVGVLAATALVPWTPPIHMQSGVVDALTGGGERSLGVLTLAGLTRVLDIYDGLPVAAEVVEQYVLFGDASLLVRTKVPEVFHLTMTGGVDTARPTWDLKVDGPAGSVVALTAGGVLYGRGVVDQDGQVSVQLVTAAMGHTAFDLTVSGPDMAPWQGTVAAAHGVSAAGDALPTVALRALGNHPNPFNPSTTIAFELVTAASVHLEVFDLAGRRVRSLVRGEVMAAGRRSVAWDGRDDRGHALGSGVYLYRVSTPAATVNGRMTLMK